MWDDDEDFSGGGGGLDLDAPEIVDDEDEGVDAQDVLEERQAGISAKIESLLEDIESRAMAESVFGEEVPDIPRDEEVQRIEESLDATWSVLTEVSGFDDILAKAGDSLREMFDQFGYQPFVDKDGGERIYLCRYEFLRTGGALKYQDGIMDVFPGDKIIYFDFLTGFPIDCIELLFMFGQYSSIYSKEQITKMQSGGVTPPVPASFFEGYDPDRVLQNITALDRELDPEYYGVYLADELKGAPKADGVKWWSRVNINTEDTFPIPGEFVGLGTRMMPGEFSDQQQSSPYLYAGNWIDYIYYTSGEVEEVYMDGDTPMLTVKWRSRTLRLKQTDYAKYEVGDRVTILKRVDTNKVTQTWEDQDTTEPSDDQWVVAPFMFYGLEYGEA
jgi:hypothetical protein